ncbi:hypothetical protein D5H75_33205 [Bailinhaonella thermotolerans]|uniref:Uncharacterized protein n=1 Tax=Bailinhaonella thermotolerans TaxID=1070861 RepID=A0A3A4AB01_9ACTN|nr:hypothetical protein D5H75_33205 [Bailinhaonella thermotolerans]
MSSRCSAQQDLAGLDAAGGRFLNTGQEHVIGRTAHDEHPTAGIDHEPGDGVAGSAGEQVLKVAALDRGHAGSVAVCNAARAWFRAFAVLPPRLGRWRLARLRRHRL